MDAFHLRLYCGHVIYPVAPVNLLRALVSPHCLIRLESHTEVALELVEDSIISLPSIHFPGLTYDS